MIDDELARELPGLPLESKTLRVDEEGFHGRKWYWFRREERVPWSAVRGLQTSKNIQVLGPGPGGRVRPLLTRPGEKWNKQLEPAWREYLLRQIERDGALAGGLNHELLRRNTHAYLVMFLGALFVFAYVILRILVSKSFPAWEQFWSWLWPALLIWGIPVVLTGWVTLWAWGRYRLISREWVEWKLGPDGLTICPEEGAGGERLLRPGPGDRITPTWAAIGGEEVDLTFLTHQPAFAPLLLALGEKNGAEARALAGPRLSWLPAPLTALAIVAFSGVVIAHWESWAAAWKAMVGVGIFGLAYSGAVFVAWYVSMRLQLRSNLREGRQAMSRLGW